MNSLFLLVPAVLLYLAAGLIFTLRLFRREPEKRPGRGWGLACGFVALGLHAGLLYTNLATSHGLNFSFFNAVSFATWLVNLLYLLTALFKPVEAMGMVLLPLAALTLILEYLFPGVRLLPPGTHWQLRIHVIISLLAYAVLAMAAVQALLLFFQDRRLRSHHPSGFVRSLPPLQTMEDLLFEMITVGFVLLTLALGSGFIFLEDMFAQHLVHKTLLSIAAWVIFAILLWGRHRSGWRGRTAIRWTLVGFATLALAYFGSKAVLELVLKR